MLRNNNVENNRNDNSRNENNRPSIFQKIISIIIQMLAMHLMMYFLSGRRNQLYKDNKNIGLLDKHNLFLKNSINVGDQFDIFVFLCDHHSLDFDYIKENNSLIYIREKEEYIYKRFSKYEHFDYPIHIDKTWNKDKYLSVILIPIEYYEKRTYPLINSKIKDEYKDLILIDNIPLTVKMFPFESEDDDKYNLISKENYKVEEKIKKELYHIKKRIDINIIYDRTKHRLSDFNVQHLKNWKINLLNQTYTPSIYLSDFWLIENDYYILDDDILNNTGKNYICLDNPYLIEKLGENNFIIEKNDNTKLGNIIINFGVCSFTYFMFTKQMTVSMEELEKSNNLFSIQNLTNTTTKKELNMFKKILLTTNIYMLIFSAIFVILHSIFFFFAFKNDMQFWYQNESMEGLSALSVVTSFVCDIILALYLYDSENTSWLLLFEIFLGLLLSGWKVTKAVQISFIKKYPYIIIKDKKNYIESMTKKYDKIAIKYVTIVLIPCLIGYSIYSLIYFRFKSWYSYIISVLAGTVYTFGFIMMTPQIYINYKLKSVEHLPWKALIYKSLNTFIDDIAFFLIDMPWMHKLSCFRDDIIFLCYIYQRCIYKVDKNRNKIPNENDTNNNVNSNVKEIKSESKETNNTSEKKKND